MPKQIVKVKATVELTGQQWFQSLVEDCKTIVCERGFSAAYEILLLKLELGRRISEDWIKLKKYQKGRYKAIQILSEQINQSPSEIYRELQFYETCKKCFARERNK